MHVDGAGCFPISVHPLSTRTLVLSGTTPPLVNVQCPEFETVVGVAPKRDRLTSCHAYEVPALTAHSPVSFAV